MAVPTSHRASMSLQGVTVEVGGYMALSNITFDVQAGTLMGVVGPNGAGKSTLFSTIAGLLPVRQGKVTLHRAEQESGGLAYVPQRESVNWRLPVTAMDVVMMGRCCRLGWFRRPGKRDREIVKSVPGPCGPVGQALRSDDGTLGRAEAEGVRRQGAGPGGKRASCWMRPSAGLTSPPGSLGRGPPDTYGDEGRIVLLATHDLTNLAGRFDQVLCLNRHVCACGPPDQVFTSDVMEQMYGAHGVRLTTDGEH